MSTRLAQRWAWVDDKEAYLKTLDWLPLIYEVWRLLGLRLNRCVICGKIHRTFLSEEFCRQQERMKLLFQDLTHSLSPPQGSKEPVPWISKWLWKQVRELVAWRDNYCCQECGAQAKRLYLSGLEIHHIIPKNMGGTDHPQNLLTLCGECHIATQSYGTGIIKKAKKTLDYYLN